MTSNAGRVGGVDGCVGGWIRVDRTPGAPISVAVYTTVDELLKASRDFAVLTVDIPIGLTESTARDCDVAARKLIGPRASSVFPAPVRAALEGKNYGDACARSAKVSGKRISKQCFAILPRIRDMDRALRESAEYRAIVREVHPEVCFCTMNEGRHLRHSKREKEGFLDRKLLVEEYFGPVFDRLRGMIAVSAAANDDILDALVALWSAERVRDGRAITLPATPPRDSFGLPMEMVA